MKFLVTLFLSVLLLSACKERCAECHKHDPVTNAAYDEFDICEKSKKDYEKAVKAAEADGFSCHERLE